MIAFDTAALMASLELGEGFRAVVYDDATGKPIVPGSTVIGHPTIAFGCALDISGMSREQGTVMALEKAQDMNVGLCNSLPWYPTLDEPRRRVLIEMAYNMGLHGLLQFKNMLAAVQVGDWKTAAAEMLNSKWATEVDDGPGGKLGRADRLAAQMETGV